jgi:hypothetical protein
MEYLRSQSQIEKAKGKAIKKIRRNR